MSFLVFNKQHSITFQHLIMKKSSLLLTIVALLGLMTIQTSCTQEGVCRRANGALATDTVSLGAFTGIFLQENADVYVGQGAQQEIIVTANEEVLDDLNFRIEDDNLIIDVEACYFNMDMEVFITVPATQPLDDLSISGSGDLVIQDSIVLGSDLRVRVSGSGELILVGNNSVNTVDVSVSGSGKANLDLDASDVDTKISGSGKAFLAGSATNLNGNISGSGDILAFDMLSQNVDVRISGSGDAEVYVDGGTLTSRISGSGSVAYKGTPSSVETRITGSGAVVDAN